MRLLLGISLSWVRNRYRRLGALPSPLWGGVGGGGSAIPSQVAPSSSHRTTPTPALRADPPHKGEGKDRVRRALICSIRTVVSASSASSPASPSPPAPALARGGSGGAGVAL